jgi:hypothetical protein
LTALRSAAEAVVIPEGSRFHQRAEGSRAAPDFTRYHEMPKLASQKQISVKLSKASASSSWDDQTRLLLWLATCVAVVSFLFYFRRGDVMLYGDAVAHINIARRVFDSKTPGLLQLGTVWLPLPHLLMIPFLLSKDLWQRGVGGSIPSLIAYAWAVVGMFRLMRGVFPSEQDGDHATSFAAWSAAVVFAANPNLIYMQTTAMGEALYLALFIWAVVYLQESFPANQRALTKSALCVAAACLTRYDGWFLASAMSGVAIIARIAAAKTLPSAERTPLWCPAAGRFVLIAAAAPILWLAYNGIVYRNPLEFENGPYSAKAIERKTQSATNPVHPGSGNLAVAGMYFLKSAEDNLAANPWLGRLWLALAGAGMIAALVPNRRPNSRTQLPLLFLLVPLPFYALSVAYGGVPIFIPEFWPHTHYNVRYGLQLLPAFSAGVAALMYFAVRSKHWNEKVRVGIVVGVVALVVISYGSIWRAGPICLQEAQVNMRSRNDLEAQVAEWLEKLPPDATLLMYLGDHVGTLERAGIPLSHVINEGNHRVWKQPADPEGLWERALANPAKYADYVVAFEGNPVAQAIRHDHLKALVEIHVMGQPRAVIYSTR